MSYHLLDVEGWHNELCDWTKAHSTAVKSLVPGDYVQTIAYDGTRPREVIWLRLLKTDGFRFFGTVSSVPIAYSEIQQGELLEFGYDRIAKIMKANEAKFYEPSLAEAETQPVS